MRVLRVCEHTMTYVLSGMMNRPFAVDLGKGIIKVIFPVCHNSSYYHIIEEFACVYIKVYQKDKVNKGII